MPRTREEIEEAAAHAAAWMEPLDPDKIPWRDASPLRNREGLPGGRRRGRVALCGGLRYLCGSELQNVK